MPDDSRDGLGRRTFVKGTGATVVGAALGNAAVGSVRADTTDGSGRGDDPSIIAHRGFAGRYPENTLGAVREASRGGRGGRAAKQGADMVEIDIVPCADGEVVVFHDSGLAERDGGERGLTDTSGLVWETPCEDVLDAEVLDSGETVPLLTDVMEAIPPNVGVNVEFKNPGSSDLRFAEDLSGEELAKQKDLWRPFTERALDVISRYDNPILVSSFYEAALATVRDAAPDLPIAFLFWDSIEEGLKITREYDAEALHPPYNMIQGTPFFGDEYYTSGPYADIDLVEVAHEEGRAVNVYTLGTWYQAERLVETGVDGIIADYPGLLGFGE